MPPLPYQILAAVFKRKCSEDDDTGTCEKSDGGFNTSLAVGLAIAVPIALATIVLLIMLWRNYRVNRREQQDFEQDPNFAPEETDLPDYPDKEFYQKEKGILSAKSNRKSMVDAKSELMNLSAPKIRVNDADDVSSTNSDANSLAGSIAQTIHKNPTLDSIALPFEGDENSNQYLNKYAKILGTDYKAYSTMKSYDSTSSLTDVSSYNSAKSGRRKNDNNEKEDDYESSTLNDPFSSTPSPSSESFKQRQFQQNDRPTSKSNNNANSTLRNEVFTSPKNSTIEEEESKNENSFYEIDASPFEKKEKYDHDEHKTEPEPEPKPKPEPEHDDHDEGIYAEEKLNVKKKTEAKSVGFADQYDPQSNPDNYLDVDLRRVSKYDELDDENLTDEQKENLRRMKSVYKVYFDRNNSVKHSKEEDLLDPEISRPQLPKVDTNRYTIDSNDDSDIPSPDSAFDDAKTKRLTNYSTTSSNYDANPTIQSTKSITNRQSTIYPIHEDSSPQQTKPLNFSSDQQISNSVPYDQQQQLHQQYDQQQFEGQQILYQDPQQYSQQHLQQYPQQYPQSDQTIYQRSPPPQQLPPPAPVKPLEPLKKLPTASELGDVTNSNFLEFQSQTKTQHKNKASKAKAKPFNPLEHSEAWSPTLSPPMNTSPGVFNPADANNLAVTGLAAQPSAAAPAPSASAMSRSSIVMLNTTDFGAAKKFKPAGSSKAAFAAQQMNPTYGSPGYSPSQQQMVPSSPPQAPLPPSTTLPKKGAGNKSSQKNLRKMLDDPLFK